MQILERYFRSNRLPCEAAYSEEAVLFLLTVWHLKYRQDALGLKFPHGRLYQVNDSTLTPPYGFGRRRRSDCQISTAHPCAGQ